MDVAIIGSGFGGLGAAIRLRRAGIDDFLIFERAGDLGGTWRANTYPGCRCDVSSNLYSFSFAPNPEWSNSYSYQPEIWTYLERVAGDFELVERIRFHHDVRDISFNPMDRLWHLTTSAGDVQARAVILATGGLAEPRLPEIEGIATFAGPLVHTAAWDDDVALDGKRVGVIGTGASAIQVIPEIAPRVDHLDVFQRTPSWILPHLGHPVKARTKRLFRFLPLTQRVSRLLAYWRRELLVLGFVKNPTRMKVGERQALEFLEASVANPILREELTPHYRLGCKRVLLSSDFYPAIGRDNVTLVTDPIARIEPGGVRTRDGVLHELDVLVCATGFYVTDNPIGEKVHGAKGVALADAFRGDLANYKGTSFPDFPNLFMLSGPNTSLGHSSIIFMLESQLNYVAEALCVGLARHALVEPTREAATAWTTQLREKLPSTVWGTGCASWYLNEHGENTTIWPDFTFRFRKATRHFEPRDHLIQS